MSDRVLDATDLARISTTQRVRPNVRLALSVLLVCAGYYGHGGSPALLSQPLPRSCHRLGDSDK
jgi:hypothetical protein